MLHFKLKKPLAHGPFGKKVIIHLTTVILLGTVTRVGCLELQNAYYAHPVRWSEAKCISHLLVITPLKYSDNENKNCCSIVLKV